MTVRALLGKRKDGGAKVKTAISMFAVGGLCALLVVFGFIEYSNASSVRAGNVANAVASQIVITFFVALYMLGGGVYLIRKTSSSNS